MAEAYAQSNVVEHTIVDMREQLNLRQRLLQQWDTSGSQTLKSLFAHLISPNTKQVDNKRWAIDVSALNQLIWENRDDCDEEVDLSKGDYPRWIDTSAMLSDCLTKTMTSCLLNETLSTSIFDVRPTEESRHQSQTQEVESVEERAGTFARS